MKRCALLLLLAAACGVEAGPRSEDTSSVMTTTTATVAAPADECVFARGRRVPRLVYQIGACAWAAGILASGEGAKAACCAQDPMGEDCSSATHWVGRGHEYYGARCWRRMSCGEINGLVLWFSTKERLFKNQQRRCQAAEQEVDEEWEYEADAAETVAESCSAD